MPNPRRPRPVEWIVSLALLAGGLALLGLGAFSVLHANTPEDELTQAQGPAREVEASESTVRGRTTRYLKFTVGDYRTQYSSDKPNFDGVLSAVSSGKPVSAWVATRQETIFPRSGWVPLYRLAADGKDIVTYAETIAYRRKGERSFWIVGGVLFALGAWATAWCVRSRSRSDSAAS